MCDFFFFTLLYEISQLRVFVGYNTAPTRCAFKLENAVIGSKTVEYRVFKLEDTLRRYSVFTRENAEPVCRASRH